MTPEHPTKSCQLVALLSLPGAAAASAAIAAAAIAVVPAAISAAPAAFAAAQH